MFRNFDRLLFAASESTPGTAASIATNTDYMEVIEPSFTVTPLQFERFTKAQTMTTQTYTAPGSAKSTPVATCEITFGMELAGPGSGVSSGTLPKMDRLLKACGLAPLTAYTYPVTGTSFSGGPFYHLENVEGRSSGSFASTEAVSLGCNAYGDTEFWARNATTLSAATITAEHSGATCTATALPATQVGVAYCPTTIYSDDTANSTVTLRLYQGGGAYVQAKGCKGTFEIAFVHGDRAVINFTFTGVLDSYTESGSTPADHSYTAEVPPAWINTGFKVGTDTGTSAYWEGALLNAMTFTGGNEVAVREDTNATNGYSQAIITNRNPQLTFNPDAVLSSTRYDFWDAFLAGTPMRLRWSVGSTAGNRVDFRVTSAQFQGIADGDRDTVSILDSTTMLTGGQFGSSIVSSGGDPSGSTFGSENEYQILFR